MRMEKDMKIKTTTTLILLIIMIEQSCAYSVASRGGSSGGYDTPYTHTQQLENEYMNLTGKRIEIGMIGYGGRPTPIRGTVINETKNMILLDKESYITCGCSGNGNLETRTGKEWINKGSATYIKEIGQQQREKTWTEKIKDAHNWSIF